tara:strand:+ start:331 stop:498 length:168 start_codon:yes stop_codon:yes gene_type:complete
MYLDDDEEDDEDVSTYLKRFDASGTDFRNVTRTLLSCSDEEKGEIRILSDGGSKI